MLFTILHQYFCPSCNDLLYFCQFPGDGGVIVLLPPSVAVLHRYPHCYFGIKVMVTAAPRVHTQNSKHFFVMCSKAFPTFFRHIWK